MTSTMTGITTFAAKATFLTRSEFTSGSFTASSAAFTSTRRRFSMFSVGTF